MIKKLNPRGIQGNMTLYDSKNNNTKPRKRLAGRNARMYKKSAKRVLCINYQKSQKDLWEDVLWLEMAQRWTVKMTNNEDEFGKTVNHMIPLQLRTI